MTRSELSRLADELDDDAEVVITHAIRRTFRVGEKDIDEPVTVITLKGHLT